MGGLASRAGRYANFSSTEEKTAHRLAERFSKILCTYIDPYSLEIWPASGYWTHNYQDCQRFTGIFPRPDLPRLTYEFGCWDLTVSQIAKGYRFKVIDARTVERRLKDSDFEITADPRTAG